jgi:hypothetical protein
MSLTLKEEFRLKCFENRALGNIFYFKSLELRGREEAGKMFITET